MTEDPVLRCQGLGKSYSVAGQETVIFSEINFSLMPGEQVAIVGNSGSGKTTLLHLLAGLDSPSSGQVWMAGESLSHTSAARQAHLRNHYLGMVYQRHHLLPELSVLDNVALPLLIRGNKISQAKQAAVSILARIGLEDRVHYRMGMLSGGERQRVALARALVTEPRVLLADEPTGNLDQKTADDVYAALLALNRGQGTSIVLVTHSTRLAQQLDRVLQLQSGCLTALPSPPAA